ncbi:MAG: hypothetical protein ACRCYR_08800 [Phycicoccus sp.]
MGRLLGASFVPAERIDRRSLLQTGGKLSMRRRVRRVLGATGSVVA